MAAQGRPRAGRGRTWITDSRRAKPRLRKALAFFFVLIAAPIALILFRTYSQLEHEARYQYRVASEEILAQLNQRLYEVLKPEEDRSFEDFRFFKVSDADKGIFQLSAIASNPAGGGF